MYKRFSYMLTVLPLFRPADSKLGYSGSSLRSSPHAKERKKKKKEVHSPSLRESGALPDEHLLAGL